MYLDYSISSGPFLSFDIEIGDGPGPELDNLKLKVYKFVIKIQYHPHLHKSN